MNQENWALVESGVERDFAEETERKDYWDGQRCRHKFVRMEMKMLEMCELEINSMVYGILLISTSYLRIIRSLFI